MRRQHTIVIGGGLAGMTVAWELARRGCAVTLLEASERLGGKAGSNLVDGRLYDHGYHVFPGWYRNTRRLLRELQIDSHLIDIPCVHYVRPGEFPQKHTLWEISSLLNLWRNLRSGLVPWYEAVLAGYYALDLSGAPFRHRGFLDRVSANGFLRSRAYATEGVAAAHQAFVLQAVSTPNYEISAMTAKRVTESWFRVPSPIFSILDGNLQETFIEPFRRAVEAEGVRVLTGHRVERLLVEGDVVSAVVLAKNGATAEIGEADDFVLATPHEVTLGLVDPELFAAEEQKDAYPIDEKRLSDLAHLRSAPMAAMHVGLRRRVPEIPPEHTVLMDSRYELSFVDVSQHWAGLPCTELSVIASDFWSLETLSEAAAREELLTELLRYLHPAVQREDLDPARIHLFTNVSVPLFLNTVGAWSYRPNTKTRLANLYIAGDYCRTQVDLTTMESAVSSGLATARRLLEDLGIPRSRGPLALEAWPAPLMRVATLSLLPGMLALGLGAQLWERWTGAADTPPAGSHRPASGTPAGRATDDDDAPPPERSG